MVCQQPSNPLSLARDRELLELGRWQTYNKTIGKVTHRDTQLLYKSYLTYTLYSKSVFVINQRVANQIE